MPILCRISSLTLAIAATLLPVSVVRAQNVANHPVSATDDPKLLPVKTPPNKAGKENPESVQKVTISGARSDLDERRQATAAKLIFGRDELDRNGDTTIGEVLKRLPGVTVGGRPGRGGDIRMRGMGNGYTQILINGERAPVVFRWTR